MKRVLLSLLVVVVSTFGLTVSADAAGGPTCGDTITHSVKLRHDIVNCAATPALKIAGSDLTLNMNGHSLSGKDTNTGIDVDGQDHVTVKDGRLRHFNTAVSFESDNADHAIRLIVDTVTTGIAMSATSNALASRNRISRATYGIIDGVTTTSDVIASNVITSASFGIFLQDAPTRLTVERNRINGGTTGITDSATGSPASVRITRNRVIRSGVGIDDTSGSNTFHQIDANTVLRSTGAGIILEGALGVDVVFGNRVIKNGGDGIQDSIVTVGVDIGDNVADKNGSYGIEGQPVVNDAGGNRAKGNGRVTHPFVQCLDLICR